MSEEQGWQHFMCSDDELYQGAAAAQAAVEAGECVVIPTDTVYGIGADPFSPEAVQRLLDAKGRGRDMPPPVLVSEPAVSRALATRVPREAEQLMEAHWPGPLTLILTAQPSLRMDLGDTEGTIALRVPDSDAARVVLRRTGPLAVSSANKTGQPPAVDVHDAIDQLGDLVSVYLDDGPTPGPQPSTIVDFTTTDSGVVVREGVLSLEQLQATVPELTLSPELEAAREAAAEESTGEDAAEAEATDVPEDGAATATEDVADDTAVTPGTEDALVPDDAGETVTSVTDDGSVVVLDEDAAEDGVTVVADVPEAAAAAEAPADDRAGQIESPTGDPVPVDDPGPAPTAAELDPAAEEGETIPGDEDVDRRDVVDQVLAGGEPADPPARTSDERR
ncbi:L-threonylcarbamoyladenylate synthase [Desertihabitans aurantiacus]|uniref:L-threonylcarbamoyladenylate synthase n=1 Tax=Desertihabitans aurantiacus TaxID=2282477 RepID=UPI001E544EC6|nr:L-threonylcarbamoyladenylate synthase [Desertihabitans aurantiacus]